MEVIFDKSFAKSIDKLKNQQINLKIRDFIITLENANSFNEIKSIKKMVGYECYYRAKIGDYRIGIEFEQNVVRLITVAHRKDIYKRFP